jgi:F-type H+-transporting ATPase subunit b
MDKGLRQEKALFAAFLAAPAAALAMALNLALFLAIFLTIDAGLTATPALAASESGGYTPEQWREFVYRIVNFIVFAGALFYLLRKPIGKFFRGRREGIARDLEYLETQTKNLEEKNAVMRRQLSELTSEREAILAQYERDGTRERDRIIAEAQKTADQIVQKTEAAMAQDLVVAKRALTAETGALAVKLAEELLAKNIQPDDQARLSHEFIESVIRLPARN